jgi:hypothetical protein
LRFFKINEGGVRGDRSETFSLVSWFPPFMHRPVTFISNTLYKVFVKVGVIEPWQYSALGDVELGVGSGLPSMNVGITGMSSGGGGLGGGPGGGAGAGGGGTRAEAERRRAMALKALDQRVKAGTHQGGAGGATLNRSNGAATSPTTTTAAPPPPTTNAPSYPPLAATGDTVKDQKSHLANGKANLPTLVVQQPSPLDSEETSGDLGASSVTSPR